MYISGALFVGAVGWAEQPVVSRPDARYRSVYSVFCTLQRPRPFGVRLPLVPLAAYHFVPGLPGAQW